MTICPHCVAIGLAASVAVYRTVKIILVVRRGK